MSNKANVTISGIRRAGLVAALSLSLAGLSTGGAWAASANDEVMYGDEFPGDSYGADPFQAGSTCSGRYGAALIGGFASPNESPYTIDGRCRF